MSLLLRLLGAAVLALAVGAAAGCGRRAESLLPPETFTWVAQRIAFSPPPEPWRREGDNGGGMLGVRFVLTGGGGQCISVGAFRLLAERDRREALAKLLSRRDSLYRREFLDALSLARARTDDPAMTNYLSDSRSLVPYDLEAALRAATAYQPTLEEILPRIRLRPERMQEPERWRIGYERDTTLAGRPAFASDDTLITPERPLLYHEVFWVVEGCAFKAVYQGTAENLETFNRVVETIRFPSVDDDASK
jgi:hypothetical protein